MQRNEKRRPIRTLVLRWSSRHSLGWALAQVLHDADSRSEVAEGRDYASQFVRILTGAMLELEDGQDKQTLNHAVVLRGANLAPIGVYRFSDSVVFATYRPSEFLIQQCRQEIEVGIRPIVVTAAERVGTARMLAEYSALDGRIEILGLEPFMLTGMAVRSVLSRSLADYVHRLTDRYNAIATQQAAEDVLPLQLIRARRSTLAAALEYSAIG